MTLVEKERLCRQELDELRRLIDFDVSSYPADVETALRFIHAHLFEESLNASRVQRQEGLRSHNLPARFKRYLGLGLRDYIEDRRIMAAMRLLWHEEVEIYLVAATVGYAHHETFTRAFKRRVGCTPSQFRTHFSHAAQGAEPPSPVVAEPPAEPPAAFADAQPHDALMFITDVVGVRTASKPPDLRVSGTASGVAEVQVSATASGESRSQVAEVGADGRWVALFSDGEDVFACGRSLLVEVGSEGQPLVRWEGPLDCAEVMPRRQLVEKEAVAQEAESDERAASRSHGGGNFRGDAAMTVTVATGRGPAPPPLIGDEGGDDAIPYYKRGRSQSSGDEQPPRAKHTERASSEAERSSVAPPGETELLRNEVAALRSQIDALVQSVESGTLRPGGGEPNREPQRAALPSEKETKAREGESTSSAEPRSKSSDDLANDLRAEIVALRRELHQQLQNRGERPAEQVSEHASDAEQRAPVKDEASVEDEASADPTWRREIRDLRDQIESLRTESGARKKRQDEAERPGVARDADETSGARVTRDLEGTSDTEEAMTPAWKRAIADLQEQVEALHETAPPRRSRDDTDEPAPAADGDGDELDEVASPQENRSDPSEAISALRERIAQLERASENSDSSGDAFGRSAGDAEARQPRSVQREVQEDASREEPLEDRRPGVIARRGVERRDLRPGSSLAHDQHVRSARREEAPVIKFEPFEVGEWTDDGRREVRVQARITHPSRQPVTAELTDDRNDRVLADGRSERGTLTLDEWVEMEPGTTTFTVAVTEPAPARLSIAWTLEERPAREEQGGGVEEGQPDESAGWVSRAIGGAWALTTALFLLSLAAGVHGFLRGLVAAGFLGFLGSYLALTIPRRWGMWTTAGIGLFALSLVTLLPFTPIVQMDGYLLVAGLATLGLVAAAVVALFVSSNDT